MEVEQLQGLPKREDVLGTVVTDERLADGVLGGVAPAVAERGQLIGRVVARHDGSDDAHPGEPGSVRDHVVQLHVHLHERLLHVLNVCGGVVDQPLAMAQVRAQTHAFVAGTEAPAQLAMLVELLQPLAHIRLAAGDVLHVVRVHEQHLEPARFEDLKGRNPVHPVDSIATVVMPTTRSQSANWWRSPLKVRKVRTGRSSRSLGTATT